MKAGQALGLLAGMGALSALGRGTDLRGNRFTGLLDMIDGGGGGKSGDRFEGGGLLSMLGNLFAKPYEAQQRVEDIAARTADRSTSPKPVLRPSTPVSGFDSQTVQDIAAANEDAYLKEAFGLVPETPSVTPDVYNIGSAGEFGGLMAPENMPRPVATTAALSPTGDTASGVAPVAPMSEQLGLMAPATPTTAYPSGMSPEAPYIPQEIMSFREFVDAERAAMSGADRYLDPANYRRGYARYLRSMGIDPVLMGM